MAEKDRAPLNEASRGPVIGSSNYVRAGNHVPAGGNVRLNVKPAVTEPEVDEVEADKDETEAE